MLSDAERRQTYDAYGHDGLRERRLRARTSRASASISDLFSRSSAQGGFDAAFGGDAACAAARCRAATSALAVAIDLAEAARGTTVEVTYDATRAVRDLPRQRRGAGHADRHVRRRAAAPARSSTSSARASARWCGPRCATSAAATAGSPSSRATRATGAGMVAEQRRVKVDIPAGIADGQRIRRHRPRPRGRARRARRATSTWSCGSREDERFLRDGEDLVTVVDVAGAAGRAGRRRSQVPTLDGDVPLDVPAGTQPGETIMMHGRGHAAARRAGAPATCAWSSTSSIPRRLIAQAARRCSRSSSDVADRGQPARGRGHARQAQAGAGRVIRLAHPRAAAPTRRSRSPSCSSCSPAGLEETDVGEGVVEYALYGAPDELPDRRAAGARRATRSSTSRPRWSPTTGRTAGRRGTGRSTSPGVRRLGAAAVGGGAGGRDGRPRHRPRARRSAPARTTTTRLCLELLLELDPGGALADWGAGSGVLAIAAARLGYAPVLARRRRAGLAGGVGGATRSATGSTVEVRRVNLRRRAGAVGADRDGQPGPPAAARRVRVCSSERRSG